MCSLPEPGPGDTRAVGLPCDRQARPVCLWSCFSKPANYCRIIAVSRSCDGPGPGSHIYFRPVQKHLQNTSLARIRPKIQTCVLTMGPFHSQGRNANSDLSVRMSVATPIPVCANVGRNHMSHLSSLIESGIWSSGLAFIKPKVGGQILSWLPTAQGKP